MTLQIRRVVTGHSAEGRAKVEIDENVKNVISNRPGASSSVIWATKGFPVNNDGFSDPTSGSFRTTVEGGTVFRVVRYEPGVTPRNHRTDSIDYAMVLDGEITLELGDGSKTRLRRHDVVVQNGTRHAWRNESDRSATIAFVLIGTVR